MNQDERNGVETGRPLAASDPRPTVRRATMARSSPIGAPPSPVRRPGGTGPGRPDGSETAGSSPAAGAAAAAAPSTASRRRLVAGAAIVALLAGTGLVAATYYVDGVPTPAELPLPESTTVYFADERTPMAKLGTENRTILALDEMTDAVKEAIVAAEDRTFWQNEGIDFAGVLRAAWNNVTGGGTQGASTITQQYARVAADLKGVTYSRKLREAVIAWKLADKYSKEEILEFYLNTVPFGRGAYGVEAAAQAFFGKTVNRNAPPARQVTLAEAMVLVAMVKQPEADPDDPEGRPGYDPTRGPRAEQNSRERWNYVREAMVGMGKLTRAEADALRYPESVKEFDESTLQSGLGLPTGLVVSHALSELWQTGAFRGKPKDYLQNGGFRIITTVDKRAQDAAVAAADIRGDKAPEVVRGQPANWQAALVAVEPGSGRVLAYYGGNDGVGADYAGWFYDADGVASGFGQHPPGSSFKVYDVAEAIRQGISVTSRWDSPATKEFPASGRTRGSAAGPIRNASSADCQPDCTLWEATVASLNVTFFALTEKIGPANVIDLAAKAGVESMWSDSGGRARPVRIDLAGRSGEEVMRHFSTEVGIGQYGITVADHANGMATFAAGGKRAKLHFVRSVTKRGDEVYAENVGQTDIGLTQDNIDELNWTLSRVSAARLPNGWDSAGKTGTWQAGTSTTRNAHTWMVGYTRPLAAAVWLGTTDGKELRTKDGGFDVFGSNYAGPIWRQFMVEAIAAMDFDRDDGDFVPASLPGQRPAPTSPPTPQPPPPSPEPTQAPPEPTPTPSPTPAPTPTSPPATPDPTGEPATLPIGLRGAPVLRLRGWSDGS